jgi:hypothetical protein
MDSPMSGTECSCGNRRGTKIHDCEECAAFESIRQFAIERYELSYPEIFRAAVERYDVSASVMSTLAEWIAGCFNERPTEVVPTEEIGDYTEYTWSERDNPKLAALEMRERVQKVVDTIETPAAIGITVSRVCRVLRGPWRRRERYTAIVVEIECAIARKRVVIVRVE